MSCCLPPPSRFLLPIYDGVESAAVRPWSVQISLNCCADIKGLAQGMELVTKKAPEGAICETVLSSIN